MIRCTPCVLCGTHRKLATVYRIAVRQPRSSQECCAIPFRDRLRACLSPTALYV